MSNAPYISYIPSCTLHLYNSTYEPYSAATWSVTTIGDYITNIWHVTLVRFAFDISEQHMT